MSSDSRLRYTIFLGVIVRVLLLCNVFPVHAQQFKEFLITPDDGPPVMFREYVDKAVVIVQSSLMNLRFESTLGIVADRSEPERGIYHLVLEPRGQLLTVKAVGFQEGKVTLTGLEARVVRYYRVEPAPATADPQASETRTVQPGGSRGKFTVLAVLPGANQIASGKVGKGLLIAGLQAAAVGLFVKYNGDIALKEEAYHRLLEAYRTDPRKRDEVAAAIKDAHDTEDKRDVFLYTAVCVYVINLLDNLLFSGSSIRVETQHREGFALPRPTVEFYGGMPVVGFRAVVRF